MSSYRIVWSERALNSLADVWMRAKHRSAVNRAVDAIDAALVERPESKGLAVAANGRVFFAPPLQALYRIMERAQTVVIIDVRILKGGSNGYMLTK